MSQVGTSKDLMVHLQVRNGFSGTSMDKVPLFEELEEGTQQQVSENGTGTIRLSHEADKYMRENQVWR